MRLEDMTEEFCGEDIQAENRQPRAKIQTPYLLKNTINLEGERNGVQQNLSKNDWFMKESQEDVTANKKRENKMFKPIQTKSSLFPTKH